MGLLTGCIPCFTFFPGPELNAGPAPIHNSLVYDKLKKNWYK